MRNTSDNASSPNSPNIANTPNTLTYPNTSNIHNTALILLQNLFFSYLYAPLLRLLTLIVRTRNKADTPLKFLQVLGHHNEYVIG